MSSDTHQTDSAVAGELQLLYSTTVTPDQIDQLGHMNVRFYGIHALHGARKLVSDLGLSAEGDGTTRAAFVDFYTRHYNEQLEGAGLEVWGGVLAVGESTIQMYFELRNPVREEFGATFVFTAQYQDSESHQPVPLPVDAADAARAAIVECPEHGQPRSIDLSKEPRAFTLEEVQALGLESREVRVIEKSHCDANGLYDVNSFQDLVWGSEGIDEDNDWLRDLENGEKMGYATMESRCSLIELPGVGARVQSFRATVGIDRKAQHERFWVFNLDTGVLLCVAAFVDVAFNINTRRAIEIPAKERTEMEAHYHPELA